MAALTLYHDCVQMHEGYGYMHLTLEGETPSKAIQLAIEVLQNWSDELLNGVYIEPEVKVICRLVKDEEGRWCIESLENGVGDIEEFDSRDEAIRAFAEYCEAPGAHWHWD
jgi:hypothetical protein